MILVTLILRGQSYRLDKAKFFFLSPRPYDMIPLMCTPYTILFTNLGAKQLVLANCTCIY